MFAIANTSYIFCSGLIYTLQYLYRSVGFFPLKKSRSKSILQVDIYILGKNIPRRLNILLGVQIKVTSFVVERAEHTFTLTLTTPVRQTV